MALEIDCYLGLRSLSTIIENDKENTTAPCMLAQTYNPSATENETRGLFYNSRD